MYRAESQQLLIRRDPAASRWRPYNRQHDNDIGLPRHWRRRGIVALAASLADDVHASDYTRWGKPGIRAQLYDIRRHTLEMDFVLEGDARSLDILNAVSPGFNCAMAFAEHVADRVG
jgi:hypothetical protein